MVLTEPGLAGIVAAVKEGRITFQRIQTYTLNSIIKKIVTVLFLIAGLIMTGHAILTPLLMVIVMVAGDFLAMSLTTDNVRPSPAPNAWRIGELTMAGVVMGVCLLAFCTGVLAVGKFGMNLGMEALRTLAFVVLVFGSQATIYAIRERRHLWACSRPSLWLAASSVADIGIAADIGRRRNRNDTVAALGGGGHARRGGCLRIRAGFREGARIRSSRDGPAPEPSPVDSRNQGHSKAGSQRQEMPAPVATPRRLPSDPSSNSSGSRREAEPTRATRPTPPEGSR